MVGIRAGPHGESILGHTRRADTEKRPQSESEKERTFEKKEQVQREGNQSRVRFVSEISIVSGRHLARQVMESHRT